MEKKHKVIVGTIAIILMITTVIGAYIKNEPNPYIYFGSLFIVVLLAILREYIPRYVVIGRYIVKL